MAVIIGNCLATLNHCMPHPALHFCGIAFTAPRAPGKGTLIFSTGFFGQTVLDGALATEGWDGTGQDGTAKPRSGPVQCWDAGGKCNQVQK